MPQYNSEIISRKYSGTLRIRIGFSTPNIYRPKKKKKNPLSDAFYYVLCSWGEEFWLH